MARRNYMNVANQGLWLVYIDEQNFHAKIPFDLADRMHEGVLAPLSVLDKLHNAMLGLEPETLSALCFALLGDNHTISEPTLSF